MILSASGDKGFLLEPCADFSGVWLSASDQPITAIYLMQDKEGSVDTYDKHFTLNLTLQQEPGSCLVRGENACSEIDETTGQTDGNPFVHPVVGYISGNTATLIQSPTAKGVVGLKNAQIMLRKSSADADDMVWHIIGNGLGSAGGVKEGDLLDDGGPERAILAGITRISREPRVKHER